MVRDLLDGFAARGWSDDLDFDELKRVPAGFVSRGLRQRHGGALCGAPAQPLINELDR